jgi:hypothetical protein
MGSFSGLARRAAARFIPRFATVVRCTACGRDRADVAHVIAGPGSYLCNGCFERAAHQLAPRHQTADSIRCRFCRQQRPPSGVTSVGDVVVCADCLGTMEVVFAEAEQTSR